MIRAGDTVTLVDTSDQTSHYVLSSSYAHDSLQNTLTLDAPPNRMDSVLQRLGLATPRSARLLIFVQQPCHG